MNVIKSASPSDIESAKYVFETTGIRDYFLLTKGWHYAFANIGRVYPRSFVEQFLNNRIDADTLIIEGGNAMKSESNVNQRTITLPTIPQKVADAIEYYREKGDNNVHICEYISIRYTSERAKLIQSIPFETLLSALINGYVIEKSAEELAHDAIRRQYQYHRAESLKATTGGGYYNGYMEAVEDTLGNLGIKITEVNA